MAGEADYKVEVVGGEVVIEASEAVEIRNDEGNPVPISGEVETKTYTAPASGELAGSATALQMPNVPCKWIYFKALRSNAGNVYIGVAGVTKADGSTDTTTGVELGPGEASPWIPVDNLNRFFRICDNAGDDLTYLVLN